MTNETEPTSIDRTHPGVFCLVHGAYAPAAYLGNERYGCWHCNPTRPAPRPWPLKAPRVVTDHESGSGEIPEWMR